MQMACFSNLEKGGICCGTENFDSTEAASQAQEFGQISSSKKKGRGKRLKQLDGAEMEDSEELVGSNLSTENMHLDVKVPDDKEDTDKAPAQTEETGAGMDASMEQNQDTAEMKD
jgi:hypothetical protein